MNMKVNFFWIILKHFLIKCDVRPIFTMHGTSSLHPYQLHWYTVVSRSNLISSLIDSGILEWFFLSCRFSPNIITICSQAIIEVQNKIISWAWVYLHDMSAHSLIFSRFGIPTISWQSSMLNFCCNFLRADSLSVAVKSVLLWINEQNYYL